MGVLLGFFLGWALGSRAGAQSYEEVVTAGKDVLRSEEFAALTSVLRRHTGQALRDAAAWLNPTTEPVEDADDVLARVRRLVTGTAGRD